jgi:hypothetical protein
MASEPNNCGPFLPDVQLVEVLATYLSEIPKGWSDMALAFGILRKLYDLGIELPVSRAGLTWPEHIDGHVDAS